VVGLPIALVGGVLEQWPGTLTLDSRQLRFQENPPSARTSGSTSKAQGRSFKCSSTAAMRFSRIVKTASSSSVVALPTHEP
jgi:hypothetical protein